jgi:hypothetical protein
MKSNRTLTFLFGTTILLSAFLVFQVQPIISKAILPWFGGTPAVWTTCMLFFQLLLFGGYCYAHFLSRLKVSRQVAIHLPLLLVAIGLLPIIPGGEWKPNGGTQPVLHILALLLTHVGLPYFLLSSTGPLVQAWFSRTTDGQSPYRLYALSNIGSLGALLSYPVWFEPVFGTAVQGRIWSVGFGLFVVVCSLCLWAVWKYAASPTATSKPGHYVISTVETAGHSYFAWLGLPALASVLLLATTNHVCQDVAVIPFLWIAPLSLYLATFIICFDREAWYSPQKYGWATMALVIVASLVTLNKFLPGIMFEALLYLATMFCGCMICHGELVRRKPAARYLTKFYLMISAGGALGGMLVAVICPVVFDGFAEMHISLIFVFVLAAAATQAGWAAAPSSRPAQPSHLSAGRWAVMAVLLVGLVVVLRGQVTGMKDNGLYATRNFYGVLRLTEEDTDDPYRRGRYMMHGRIAHGFQHFHPDLRRRPTMYFASESGIGITLLNMSPGQGKRVGVVGLGVGTLAAYGKPGDCYRFYEINPEVEMLARRDFTYLSDCQAEHEVVLGDARLSLEREPPGNYDILILDAFSGDALPAHLITAEALEVYKRHVVDDGIIAFNISNNHLDLERVLTPLAELHDYEYLSILATQDVDTFRSPSLWFIMSKNRQFMSSPAMVSAARGDLERYVHLPVWTDQYNNLLHILK